MLDTSRPPMTRLKPAAAEPAVRRAPTIYEVASKANVSIKTVSRVLNGEPNVRPNVHERVMAAVAELGYRPKMSARGLAGGRQRLAGWCSMHKRGMLP